MPRPGPAWLLFACSLQGDLTAAGWPKYAHAPHSPRPVVRASCSARRMRAMYRSLGSNSAAFAKPPLAIARLTKTPRPFQR